MTSDAPTGFRSRTRDVVESFLRTVVLLDDLAVMSTSTSEPTGAAASAPLSVPDYPQSPTPKDDIRRRDPQGVRLDADAVIGGFADIGSVCAVLNPAPGDEFRERTVKTARRADIVILDWKIHESVGDAALDVMRDILLGDRQRLRLMAFYTGEPNLREIFNRIKDVATEFYEDDELLVIDDFRISKGPLHIVLLAKQGTLNDLQPELRNQEVAESQLADRLAHDFALMTGGLIRNCAIAGITAIRDNAHRILAKFEPSVDPAYLGHRLLLPHPPDTEDHLVEALGSELISVLEENRPGACADVDAIGSWLEQREHEGLGTFARYRFPKGQKAVDGWRDLLSRGIDDAKATLPIDVKKSELEKQATEPFAKDAEDALRSNRRLAALLRLKTRYPGRPPRLSIGSLLSTREDDEDRYFLCLQPKCDSVRLPASTGFPLIPLIPLEDVEVKSQGTSLRLVLETSKDQWKDFGIKPKPSELSIRFFKPSSNPPGEVVATEMENGGFFFEDNEGRKYRWMAEMKDEHALGIAGEVASALARPGPNDAEWLRKAAGTPPEPSVGGPEQNPQEGR